MHVRSRTYSSFKNVLLGFAMVVAAVGLTIASPSASNASAVSTSAGSTAPPCPTGYTCETIPSPCPSGSVCPTVEAGPTSNIGTNPAQYVFVHLYNFPADDTVQIWLCQDTTPLSKAPPICSTAPAPGSAPILSDGTGFVTYSVPEVTKTGNAPISGEVPGNPTVRGSFYCDDGPDYCSLGIFDTSLDGNVTPDTTNTAIVPITYAAGTSGCRGANLVNTESDYGIEGLIGDANETGCAGSHPALAVDTADDSLQAVTDVASGSGVQIGFTDDPEAADEQAAIAGKHIALIPIAASADVVGFAADVQSTQYTDKQLYPQTAFELTPNMVAGLVTTAYDDVGDADTIPTSCKTVWPSPKKLDPCAAMEVLNELSGFLPQEFYQAYVRLDNAGVTDELFQWLCNAPDDTVPIDGETLTETESAAKLLETTDWAETSLDGHCPDTDQFPALGDKITVNAEAIPEQQAQALYDQVNPGDTNRQAGFAIMNWYEAAYYGLIPAELQNAAGDFVAPSEASVDSALGDATQNPDGTLSFDYTDTSNTAAYPEPVVFYAAVSTKAQPAAQATAIRTVLDNMLALTSSSSKSTLPDGVLPLTASLTSEAKADIAKDIVSEPSSPGQQSGGTKPGGGSTGDQGSEGTTPNGSGGYSGSGGSSGYTNGSAGSNGSASGGSGVTTGSSKPSTSASDTKASSRRSKAPSVFHAVQLALAEPEWRWLLVSMLIAGAAALCAGPFLIVLQRFRRRLAVTRRDES